MIVFVTTGSHKYAPAAIADLDHVPEVMILSYNQLFRRKRLPAATYIFSDFDRLTFWQTELAALVYRALKSAGIPVMNDPAQVLHRLPLLKTLLRNGVNKFQVWDCACDPEPDRFPVFLRTRGAHRGTLTDLLNSAEEATAAKTKALEDGYGLQDLMFVEYCAEPLENGVFRKWAAYKVGDQIQTGLAVHESHWQAKYGEDGLATDGQYDDEFASIESNAFAEPLVAAFQLANVDYGRVDFAIVDGVPQVYEINTNPHFTIFDDHPSQTRLASQALFCERVAAAFEAIDHPYDRSTQVDLDHPSLIKQRKKDWPLTRERWII